MTLELIQGSDDWHMARLGKVTGSRVADVVNKLKSGKWGAERAKYFDELVCERLTGKPTDHQKSKAMRDGTEREPEARVTYELENAVDVVQVGFVPHPTITMAGCSPDGLVGSVGLVSFKCPLRHTHIATLRDGKFDPDYMMQMQWEMACMPERTQHNFVSFHPDFPPEMQTAIIRIDRNQETIKMLEEEVVIFLKEIDEQVAELESKYGMKKAA